MDSINEASTSSGKSGTQTLCYGLKQTRIIFLLLIYLTPLLFLLPLLTAVLVNDVLLQISASSVVISVAGLRDIISFQLASGRVE